MIACGSGINVWLDHPACCKEQLKKREGGLAHASGSERLARDAKASSYTHAGSIDLTRLDERLSDSNKESVGLV